MCIRDSANTVETLAEAEGLQAHKNAVTIRLKEIWDVRSEKWEVRCEGWETRKKPNFNLNLNLNLILNLILNLKRKKNGH